MRTIAMSLVSGLALLAAGCGRQTPDANAVPAPATQASAPNVVGMNNPNVRKNMECVAAIARKHESAQQQAKDGELCDKEYPPN